MRRRIRFSQAMASNTSHIAPAAFDGDVHEAGRGLAQHQRLQPKRLLEEIAATIDSRTNSTCSLAGNAEHPQKERRSGEHRKCR
jgi:hypothetical protein